MYPGWPRTIYVEQAGLELTEFGVPLPPVCWDWQAPPVDLSQIISLPN